MRKTILNVSAVLILSIVLTLSEGCGKEDAVIDLERDSAISDPGISTYDELTDDNDRSVPDGTDMTKENASTEVPCVTVYVCGAVKHAGVYELKGQARVIDAIKAAGGMNDQADTDYINQAMLLEDGQKIYVPTLKETESLGSDALLQTGGIQDNKAKDISSGNKVNINTADASELMTLPGIGEAKAAMIIEYRVKSGRFESVEDIMKINGIKEGMFNRIKDRICI